MSVRGESSNGSGRSKGTVSPTLPNAYELLSTEAFGARVSDCRPLDYGECALFRKLNLFMHCLPLLLYAFLCSVTLARVRRFSANLPSHCASYRVCALSALALMLLLTILCVCACRLPSRLRAGACAYVRIYCAYIYCVCFQIYMCTDKGVRGS